MFYEFQMRKEILWYLSYIWIPLIIFFLFNFSFFLVVKLETVIQTDFLFFFAWILILSACVLFPPFSHCIFNIYLSHFISFYFVNLQFYTIFKTSFFIKCIRLVDDNIKQYLFQLPFTTMMMHIVQFLNVKTQYPYYTHPLES